MKKQIKKLKNDLIELELKIIEVDNKQFGSRVTHLPARSRRSDSRSADAAESDVDYRGESADAAAGRGME